MAKIFPVLFVALGIGTSASVTAETIPGQDQPRSLRADILDRNGTILATTVPTVWLSANPRNISDPDAVAREVVDIFPNMTVPEVAAALMRDRASVTLSRHVTAKQQGQIRALNIRGLRLEKRMMRIYPHGAASVHAVGLTDTDGKGIAGIEKMFDSRLTDQTTPLQLSLDVGVQEVVRAELAKTITESRALGGMGLVMDVGNGDVIAMVSLPDFDPAKRDTMPLEAMFNRTSLGVYQLGGISHLFNAAAALDVGTATLATTYDVSKPIQVGLFRITDNRPHDGTLSVGEIFRQSSSVGAARMAGDLGADHQKAFLDRLGLLRRASIELPEVGTPLFPSRWREINTMTIAYGYGLAVSPLQFITAASALVNGGNFHPATLIRHQADDPIPSNRVISEQTSCALRRLMNVAVSDKRAQGDDEAYDFAGKWGTAIKANRHMAQLVSFVAAFPASQQRYAILLIIDEPEIFKAPSENQFATPATSRIIGRIAPLLGIQPVSVSPDGEREQDDEMTCVGVPSQ